MPSIRLGLGVDRSLRSNWTAPFKADALVWLDGTILDVTGTKYFVDKISGKNFLITGYDFDTTWYGGFPYKSAATISAPAGDVTLIAEDINNYLYDSGGNPNQIPVISLFQDIDYEHKFFCRHLAQGVDGDGVEFYEPRVIDVVLYNTVKSGADLTTCNTSFGVPAIDANAKWIDPINGVDATGNGTQALPYKTHAKVLSLTLTEGTLVYCQSGTFAPFAWNKNYQLKGIGLTKILNVSGSRGIDYDPAGTLAQTIEGYIIDMADYSTAVCFNGNITHALTLKRIRFQNHVGVAHQSSHATLPLLTAQYCTYTKNVQNINNNVTFLMDTCYIKNAPVFMWSGATNANAHVTIKNSNINAISTNLINLYKAQNVTFIGNKYVNSGEIAELSNANANSGTISVTYNNFVSSINKSVLDITHAGYTLVVNNNRLSYTVAALTNFNLEGAVNEAQNNILINYNGALALKSTNQAHNSTVKFNNNKILSKTITSSYCIMVGAEASSANNNKITYAELLNNYLSTEVAGTQHGFLCGFVGNYKIKYNKSIGSYIGGVVKGGANADNIISHNLLKDCTIGFWWKDAVYSNFINNTISGSGDNFRMTENLDTNIGCSNMVVKNNFLQANDIVITDSTGTFNYNIYKVGIPIASGTFAQWQALGNEANGREENITLVDMIPTIPISEGEDLGSTYDDGLDSSTSWGSDTKIPIVVKKQQGASWDIGAYVH